MKNPLHHIILENFLTASGNSVAIPLSYETFGLPLHTAPVVLVNHALTGNSTVAGAKGWWQKAAGEGASIDTRRFTVLAFNIPGNGYDGHAVQNYHDFICGDIARIFLAGLAKLKIEKLHSMIGGSLGAAIGWEMLALKPNLAEYFIPIASDFRTSDWLHAQCLVQEFLLNTEDEPLQKARIHAMLCYRTPQSLNGRFNLERGDDQKLLSENWLHFHGKALSERFTLNAYKLMNRLLKTINADATALKKITAEIHLVAVNSDLFFPSFEIHKCYEHLRKSDVTVVYHEIDSVHGHDAFLIEYEQLNKILKTIYI